MEDLLCAESPCFEGPFAGPDQTLLEDSRVMDRLIDLQQVTIPVQDYFKSLQTDIQPYMRKVVATWMLEVCEEQGCEDQVFGVSVNILDRFLCTQPIKKEQLQLLGSVCLLLASKWRQSRPLSIDLLSYYTDNSISHEEIKKWELVVLSKLGWDLSAVTAGDFLEHLLKRVPGGAKHPLVRRHSATFIALAATEPEFLQAEPCSVAVAAIGAAVRGLRFPNWRTSLTTMADTVKIDVLRIERVMKLIEDTVERESAMLPDPLSQHSTPTQASNTKHQTSPQTSDFFEGSETPTDISDIMF